ncbi:MAG: DNA-protecting protein DprA [Clostridiales bacterium]|nr:MAG: DNA-protecting protein DprA [Clostridiales bacterium]
MNDLYLVWLLSLTNKQFLSRNYKLLKQYNSGKALYEACQGNLDKNMFSDNDRRELCSCSLDRATELLDKYRKEKIEVITYYDKNYPSFLREIPSPPAALFVKGTLPNTCENPAITIIGTRNCSDDGRKNSAKFAYALSSFGFTVVSGLARGIDTYSHKGCLLAATSPTVAVLAGGVDRIYPPENRELYAAITQNGAVISEALPGTEPLRSFFPIRNRILSGMTFGTLIVETAAKGGSLITASCALEQNRLVFAIPGGLNASESKGTNALIKEGAIFCNGISVILEEYYPIYGDKIKVIKEEKFKENAHKNKELKKSYMQTLDENEQKICQAIGSEQLSADAISAKTDIPISCTLVLLQQLELKGIIKPIKGGLYIVRL